jgi:FtsP/CotA-like multicopper oxidase with cupredoxin domain
MLCDGMLALRGGAMLSFSGALIAAAFFCAPPAYAQLPALPGGPVNCPPANQSLVRIPEIRSDSGKLAGTLTLITAKQRVNLAGTNCFDQYVRQFVGGTVVPNYPGTSVPIPAPAGGYYDPVPAPTLRGKLGDIVQLTFLNQVVVGPWWQNMDRGEKGEGCDNNASVPYPGPDQFPDCFHGSSTGNIHFHGTHTSPSSTGDNVFIEVRPSPQQTLQNTSPTVTAASVLKPFTEFFANCTTELNKSVLSQWPTKWADLPQSWRAEQEKLLKAYDANPTIKRKLWPVNAAQIKEGAWPQFYIGAYPYCYRIPPYTAQGWPAGPAVPPAHGPNQTRRALQMGQAPGTHWYHAHKHGSTAINVSNGMTGVFIIEGKYDEDLNKYYGTDWTRRQPVMVINELGTVPNLFSNSRGHPPISINGRVMPKVTMQPGEVQMWRIANTSSRSGVFLAGVAPVPPPAPASITPTAPLPALPTTPSPWGAFEVKQIAQDGVQFLESNYNQTLNQNFLLAAGNRADILIKAPANQTGQTQLYTLQYRNAINAAEAAGGKPLTNLLIIEVPSGTPVSGNASQFIASPNYPTFPPFLADITDAEVKGTKVVTFESTAAKAPLPAGAPPFTMHMIDGKRFEGNVGEVVLLNTVEEWKIQNRTVGPPIDHPFHIHINPFQITEVFSPAATIPNPAGGNPLPKYVFYNTNLQPGQCYLNPNDPASWNAPSTPNSPSSWGPSCPPTAVPAPRIWWDVFPIPTGLGATDQNNNPINGPDGKQIVVPGYFKMRSRFVDYTGTYVIHCHILAHEDRGMMTVVQVVPFTTPYSHQ